MALELAYSPAATARLVIPLCYQDGDVAIPVGQLQRGPTEDPRRPTVILLCSQSSQAMSGQAVVASNGAYTPAPRLGMGRGAAGPVRSRPAPGRWRRSRGYC